MFSFIFRLGDPRNGTYINIKCRVAFQVYVPLEGDYMVLLTSVYGSIAKRMDASGTGICGQEVLYPFNQSSPVFFLFRVRSLSFRHAYD